MSNDCNESVQAGFGAAPGSSVRSVTYKQSEEKDDLSIDVRARHEYSLVMKINEYFNGLSDDQAEAIRLRTLEVTGQAFTLHIMRGGKLLWAVPNCRMEDGLPVFIGQGGSKYPVLNRSSVEAAGLDWKKFGEDLLAGRIGESELQKHRYAIGQNADGTFLKIVEEQ